MVDVSSGLYYSVIQARYYRFWYDTGQWICEKANKSKKRYTGSLVGNTEIENNDFLILNAFLGQSFCYRIPFVYLDLQ